MLSKVNIGSVYVLWNKKSGKYYVGQTTRSVSEIWREHARNAEAGCKFPLHRAIRKHGLFSFAVVFEIPCKTKRELNKNKKALIMALGTREKKRGYNITNGGEGGAPFSGHQHTASTKKKISSALKGVKKPKGFGEKVSAGLKKYVKTPRHRANLSGKNNGMFGRTGPLNPAFGRKRPDLSARNRKRAR